ncbi:type 1 glutamine amidotransferase domain-containing protein [Caulobacter sp. 17J65-9]|uniref:type 1 glutamine amidotransferase domain-containing protein n=1 Tax=Caulobacter sp. 17J65-9 TaxID=2709382 RepID=UPI0013CAC3E5|nr:type 1 glutamine amidotransferase domain-containing protein [Caulobacter sp. 17J65-9]NEX92627.1 type 1 glutamine amidotransferase domain-containing protein [Caulobacter sp. 17J65-9]
MHVLLVLTSHDRLGDTGKKTGFWLEELAAPYYAFKDAGARVTLATPAGGQPPLDPKSDEPENQTEATKRFRADKEAMAMLASTKRLTEVAPDDFDALFYPGGHGPMWDLAEDRHSIALAEGFVAEGKPVAAVCHGPVALAEVRRPDGEYLIKGRKVTAFTNAEERAVHLESVVPFLLEDRLKQRGAKFVEGPDWAPHVEVDGDLVTGQNPASSAPAAQALITRLRQAEPTTRPERGDERRV